MTPDEKTALMEALEHHPDLLSMLGVDSEVVVLEPREYTLTSHKNSFVVELGAPE